MQTYDIIMLLVLVSATLFGFFKGMAWQIASLASLVLSYFVALRFADELAPTFEGVAPPPLNKFVAMLVIYMVTSIAIWMVFRVVRRFIDKVKLEYFDRQMGAIFGFAKGVGFCVAITFFAVSLVPQTQKEAILASNAGHYIVALLDKTHTVVPPELHDVVSPYLNRIEERLDPNYQPSPGEDIRSLWEQADSTIQWQQPLTDQTPSAPTQTGQSGAGYPEQPTDQANAGQWRY